MHSTAAHLREIFIVLLASDRVCVTDELNAVFIKKVWNGVKPSRKLHRLEFVYVPAASIEIDALTEFFLRERLVRSSQTQQQQRTPKHVRKLANSRHSIRPELGHSCWNPETGNVLFYFGATLPTFAPRFAIEPANLL
jgi:hypothetical protein